MNNFIIGQRWINEAELKLGLGTIINIEGRTVDVEFNAIDEIRTYAIQNSPLSRVVFEEGDLIKDKEGNEIIIEDVMNNKGFFVYGGHTKNNEFLTIPELNLNDFTQLNRANQRLFAGQIDKPSLFALRQQSRRLSDHIAQADQRGLSSARTSLIPHQLYIANEVASRQAPRVLLADEVGLGKTIEAGLILNTQIIRGQAQRVLVLVPDALVNQWLVEMLRKFNLLFSIFDEERCRVQDSDDEFAEVAENPFESAQLALASINLFKDNPDLHAMAIDAGWDMLIVDEAHHLEWTPEHSSLEYGLVETLAQQTPSVLLLTATPEQLGKQGHFARLRLLDPDRFYDYQQYLEQESNYSHIADAIELLQQSLDTLTESQWQMIQQAIDSPTTAELQLQPDNLDKKNQLIQELLDQHGTGRVLFRNTRAAIKGFPQRELHASALPLPEPYQILWEPNQPVDNETLTDLLTPERLSDHDQPWYDIDPRVEWLIQLIDRHPDDKILIIAAHASTALELSEALRIKMGLAAAVFHEGLSIVERDKAAAFFADSTFGAQCLICSEIGSEGRNFQFAHHMVLFDLPLNPDLLEQRIGRLDRIGQTDTIRIHVPYLESSPQQRLFEFYHQGLNAFEQTCVTSQAVLKQESEHFYQSLIQSQPDESFLARVKALREQKEIELHAGRDRLLELNSCRLEIAQQLVKTANEQDQDHKLEEFIENFCSNYGIEYEEQLNGSFIIRPSENQLTIINQLPDDGMTMTYSRDVAAANEDWHFFTWDHPFVTEAMDTVLSSELGNSNVTSIKFKGVKPGTLMLECFFVLETATNRRLQTSRYLPSSQIRFLIDEQGRLLSKVSSESIDQFQQKIKRNIGSQVAKAKRNEIRKLIELCSTAAGKTAQQLRQQALDSAEQQLNQEIDRLKTLQKSNPNVRDAEINALMTLKSDTLDALSDIDFHLDSLRVIVCL